MARTPALSIYVDQSVKAELMNKIAGVFENLAKKTISGRLKSKNGALSEKAGSFEFKRFANANRQAYGTARAAGEGNKVKATPVVVNLDRDSEIVEEVNAFDAASFTEDDLNAFLARRQTAVQQSVERDLDREFFAAVKTGGTKSAVTIDLSKPIVPQLEEAIVAVEMTSNEYVDGVDRELMALVLSPSLYGKVKTELNDCYNFAGTTADEVFKGINGVASFSSNRLPEGVDFEIIVMDSVAQPVTISAADIEKIPLSNEYAVEIFYRNGTKVLAKELAHHGSVTA
jgi:hypothetical protein